MPSHVHTWPTCQCSSKMALNETWLTMASHSHTGEVAAEGEARAVGSLRHLSTPRAGLKATAKHTWAAGLCPAPSKSLLRQDCYSAACAIPRSSGDRRGHGQANTPVCYFWVRRLE
jgi:hypothetical protein